MYFTVMGIILLLVGLMTIIHFGVETKRDYFGVKAMSTSLRIFGIVSGIIVTTCAIITLFS